MSPELIVAVGFFTMVVLIVSLLICAHEHSRKIQDREANFSKLYNKLLDLSNAVEKQHVEHIKKLEEELKKSQSIIALYPQELNK